MKRCFRLLFILLVAASLSSCRAEVKKTNDSVKVEVDVPKVEVKKTPDLDPKTDDDVDITLPKPEDK